jgi:hypothetical protein
MTRGQQAVFNLRWLRDFMESTTFLAYADEPMLRSHRWSPLGKARDMSATTIQPVGQLVADQMRAHLPGPDVLTPEQRLGSPDRAASLIGHTEYPEELAGGRT